MNKNRRIQLIGRVARIRKRSISDRCNKTRALHHHFSITPHSACPHWGVRLCHWSHSGRASSGEGRRSGLKKTDRSTLSAKVELAPRFQRGSRYSPQNLMVWSPEDEIKNEPSPPKTREYTLDVPACLRSFNSTASDDTISVEIIRTWPS